MTLLIVLAQLVLSIPIYIIVLVLVGRVIPEPKSTLAAILYHLTCYVIAVITLALLVEYFHWS